jgi:hypothetical protein
MSLYLECGCPRNGWFDFSLRGSVVGALGGRDADAHLSRTLQQLTQSAFGDTFVLVLLQLGIHNLTILLDCPTGASALALRRGDLIALVESSDRVFAPREFVA